jgi:hypothetical protein
MNKKLVFPILVLAAFISLIKTAQAGPLFDFVSNAFSSNTINRFYANYETWIEFILYLIIFISLVLGVFKERFGKNTKMVGIAMGVALSFALVNFSPGLVGKLGPLAFLIFVALIFYLIFSSIKQGFESKWFSMAIAYIVSFIVLWIVDPQGKLNKLFESIPGLNWIRDLLVLLFVIALLIVGFTLIYKGFHGFFTKRDKTKTSTSSEKPLSSEISIPTEKKGGKFWNKLIKSLIGAEKETEKEMKGLERTEDQLAHVPELLEDLKKTLKSDIGNRNEQAAVNKTARKIMEIIVSAKIHEEKFIDNILNDISPSLAELTRFYTTCIQSQTIEKLKSVSDSEEFKNSNSEFKDRLLNVAKDLPGILEKIVELNNYFTKRFDKKGGDYSRLTDEFGNYPKLIEHSFGQLRVDEIETYVDQMIKIQKIMEGMLKELIEKERELRNLIATVEITENKLTEIQGALEKTVGTRGKENKEELLDYANQTKSWLISVKSNKKLNESDKSEIKKGLKLLQAAESLLTSESPNESDLRQANTLCAEAGKIAHTIGRKI